MKIAAKEAQVAEPEFELTGFFKVTFKRNSIQSTDVSDRQAIKASDRKCSIQSYIKEHKQVTASEASAFLGLSMSRVRAVLLEMVSDGTIEKISDKRYAYYVLKS